MFGRKKRRSKSPAKVVGEVESEVGSKLTRKERKVARKAADKAVATPPTLFDKVTDPKTARRALAAAKVAGPALAPFFLKAATAGRGWWDDRRAQRLGVTATEVGAYRGPTGATEARLTGLGKSIDELRARRVGDLQVSRFADVAKARLADLTTAARAAASMPANRRRVTLKAVARDLDRIDADLMTYLVPSAA